MYHLLNDKKKRTLGGYLRAGIGGTGVGLGLTGITRFTNEKPTQPAIQPKEEANENNADEDTAPVTTTPAQLPRPTGGMPYTSKTDPRVEDYFGNSSSTTNDFDVNPPWVEPTTYIQDGLGNWVSTTDDFDVNPPWVNSLKSPTEAAENNTSTESNTNAEFDAPTNLRALWDPEGAWREEEFRNNEIRLRALQAENEKLEPKTTFWGGLKQVAKENLGSYYDDMGDYAYNNLPKNDYFNAILETAEDNPLLTALGMGTAYAAAKHPVRTGKGLYYAGKGLGYAGKGLGYAGKGTGKAINYGFQAGINAVVPGRSQLRAAQQQLRAAQAVLNNTPVTQQTPAQIEAVTNAEAEVAAAKKNIEAIRAEKAIANENKFLSNLEARLAKGDPLAIRDINNFAFSNNGNPAISEANKGRFEKLVMDAATLKAQKARNAKNFNPLDPVSNDIADAKADPERWKTTTEAASTKRNKAIENELATVVDKFNDYTLGEQDLKRLQSRLNELKVLEPANPNIARYEARLQGVIAGSATNIYKTMKRLNTKTKGKKLTVAQLLALAKKYMSSATNTAGKMTGGLQKGLGSTVNAVKGKLQSGLGFIRNQATKGLGSLSDYANKGMGALKSLFPTVDPAEILSMPVGAGEAPIRRPDPGTTAVDSGAKAKPVEPVVEPAKPPITSENLSTTKLPDTVKGCNDEIGQLEVAKTKPGADTDAIQKRINALNEHINNFGGSQSTVEQLRQSAQEIAAKVEIAKPTYESLRNYTPAVQNADSIEPKQLQTSIEATAKRIADLEPLCIDLKANRWQRGLAGDAIGVEEGNLAKLCQKAVAAGLVEPGKSIDLGNGLYWDSARPTEIQQQAETNRQKAVERASKAKATNKENREGKKGKPMTEVETTGTSRGGAGKKRTKLRARNTGAGKAHK